MPDDELPKLFSDDEFKAQVEIRERRENPERREVQERRVEERRRETTQLGRRPSDGLPESTLEQQFPHLAKKLTTLWRSEACAFFLGGLLISDRPNRQGFPYDVLEDLIMLNELNSTLTNVAPDLGIRMGGAKPAEHK